MTFKQVAELTDGTAMVVTDLHGNGDVYDILRDKFLKEYQAGRIQRFVLCGDLIHGNGTAREDDSVRMLGDVMRLQREMGADTVVMLLGNHEFPHIYGQSLSRGRTEFTSRFEQTLSAAIKSATFPFSRQDVTDFLMNLPFFAVTKAGVMLTHAGPADVVNMPTVGAKVLDFDHAKFLTQVDAKLADYDFNHARLTYSNRMGKPYDVLVKHYLAVEDEHDPRYHHLLRSFVLNDNQDYDLLWGTLFAQNELQFPNDLRRVIRYEQVVNNFLDAINHNLPNLPQHVVASGHISTRGGFQVVDDFHLRIASYEHANPKSAGKYLLLDCARTTEDADSLVPMLRDTLA